MLAYLDLYMRISYTVILCCPHSQHDSRLSVHAAACACLCGMHTWQVLGNAVCIRLLVLNIAPMLAKVLRCAYGDGRGRADTLVQVILDAG